MNRTSVALVHHPCVDRNGKIYTTAITNLDVHDIARSCRTYGVDTFYVVTPITAQQDLANAIVSYWKTGTGKRKNVDRAEALSHVTVVATLEDAIKIEAELCGGAAPYKIATSAKPDAKIAPFSEEKKQVAEKNTLVIFGTGHGLAPSVLEMSDRVLEPIYGKDGYNHLSVRSAVAIILDRLLA